MSSPSDNKRPILFLDVDGVISLFGFPGGEPPGRFHSVDGVMHCIGHGCGELLGRVFDRYDVVWATGWEEKANEYLPFLLELPVSNLPVVSFEGRVAAGAAHWKLEAIEAYAASRPAAWVDDNLDERCRRWAQTRDAPTLLVPTESPIGLAEEHVEALLRFAGEVGGGARAPAPPSVT